MSKTILVVDDSATIREAVRHALAGEDWTVVEATDATEALAAARSRPPDAVLCDVSLGDGDGYETCRALRDAAVDPIPVLLMGARVSHAAALAAGAAATLPKPFGATELLSTLQAALEESSFGLDFVEAEVETDAPLTLAEAESDLPRPTAIVDGVEIIDLSSDEDFADLELLEDLEPIGPLKPSFPPSEPAPLDLLGHGEDPFAGLFSPPPAAPPAPVAAPAPPTIDIDLFDLLEEPAAIPTATAGAVHPEDVGEELAQVLEPEFSEHPESYLHPEEIEEAAPPAAAPPSKGLSSLDVAAATDLAPRVAAAAERAVRDALSASLTAEHLGPLVEAAVERAVWEIVPQLAERLIREALEKLQSEPPTAP